MPPLRPALEAARRAPSAHNTQPWLFEVTDGAVAVKWVRSRELPSGDPQHRYLLTSLGAAVEAMSLTAARAGFDSEVNVNISMSDRRAANVRFLPSQTSTHDAQLAEGISRRQTSRIPFDREPLSSEAFDALAHEATASGGSLAVMPSRQDIDRIAKLHAEATCLNIEDSPVNEEFLRWLRLDKRDPAYQRDGLTLEALSLGRVQTALAPWVMTPSGLGIVKVLRLHRLFIARAQLRLVRRSPAVCLLVGRSASLEDSFLGGRMMMRVWLTATNLGLSVHPITAMMDNAETRTELAGLFGVGSDAPMVVCFRLGASALAPRSHRLPIREIVTQK